MPDIRRGATKSLRGILAYQASTRQRGALIHSPPSNITGEPSNLVGVSSRGRISGRGRLRVRGISRGRSRAHRNVLSSRARVLDEHRSIVGEICEDDVIAMESEDISDREPMLADGNFMNVSHCVLFTM